MSIRVETVGELAEVLAPFKEGFLFRGQTQHFEKDGHPSIVSSFDRQGCIPSKMLRWGRYADLVLHAFMGSQHATLLYQQALLQHYGWRSFYVDCSANPAVSAWFASHSYHDERIVEMSEDYEERPVFLRKRSARYALEEGMGHLYVFPLAMAQRVTGVTNLAELHIEGARLRPQAQNAWLMGPIRNNVVPPECFAAHIEADRAIFYEYAASAGYSETRQLFPPPAEDPILASLLELPWRFIPGIENAPAEIPAFERSLDLPEYQPSFRKRYHPRVAFFNGAKVADACDIAGASEGCVVVGVPEIVIFGTADPSPLRFPKIMELLSEHKCAVFEVNHLIKHPTMGNTAIYQKGVVAWERSQGLFEVCELGVEHPGLDLLGASLSPGWFYRLHNDGLWYRENSPNDCDCGESYVHERHISALHIAEAFLADPDGFGEDED